MSEDIKVELGEYLFLCRACVLIKNGNYVLFQKKKNDIYWALPGGKIKVGEKTIDTLKRELKEELNVDNLEVGKIISITENFFSINNKKIHQYIFTHEAKITDKNIIDNNDEFESLEDDSLVYKWLKLSEIKDDIVKPNYLPHMISQYNENIIFESCQED